MSAPSARIAVLEPGATVTASKHENLMLKRLFGADAAELRLAGELESVHLEAGAGLFAANDSIAWVYFPATCVVSAVTLLESGKTVESFSIGRESLVGLMAALPDRRAWHSAVVTIPGSAWRVPARALHDVVREPGAAYALLAATHAHLAEASQTAVCHRAHAFEQQIARWLLTLAHRAGATDLQLTHEAIASRLGTRRASVSVAIERFDRDGLVAANRGSVRLRHPSALAGRACECYDAIRLAWSALDTPYPASRLAERC